MNLFITACGIIFLGFILFVIAKIVEHGNGLLILLLCIIFISTGVFLDTYLYGVAEKTQKIINH